MPTYAIAAILLLGGGTSFAATGSVPGDLLYPVKVGVNEEIRSALAISQESEARLQAELLEERIEEAEELKADGRLEGELAVEVRQNVQDQARVAEEESNEAESAEVKTETMSRIMLSLNSFNALVGSEGLLAISVDGNGSLESESTTGTSLALEEVSTAFLYTQVEARIAALKEVIAEHRSELSAEVYAEYNSKLETASELVVQARAEANEEATRAALFEASDLMGEIESDISLRGTVEIDTETGFIVDVDFSKQPVLDLGDTESRSDNVIESTVGGDAVIDINDEAVETGSGVNTSIESTSGLSL